MKKMFVFSPFIIRLSGTVPLPAVQLQILQVCNEYFHGCRINITFVNKIWRKERVCFCFVEEMFRSLNIIYVWLRRLHRLKLFFFWSSERKFFNIRHLIECYMLTTVCSLDKISSRILVTDEDHIMQKTWRRSNDKLCIGCSRFSSKTHTYTLKNINFVSMPTGTKMGITKITSQKNKTVTETSTDPPAVPSTRLRVKCGSADMRICGFNSG